MEMKTSLEVQRIRRTIGIDTIMFLVAGGRMGSLGDDMLRSHDETGPATMCRYSCLPKRFWRGWRV